jgi:hypothetical protein
MDWIDLAQDRDWWQQALVNALMNLWVAKNVGNLLTGYGPLIFSRTLLHGV